MLLKQLTTCRGNLKLLLSPLERGDHIVVLCKKLYGNMWMWTKNNVLLAAGLVEICRPVICRRPLFDKELIGKSSHQVFCTTPSLHLWKSFPMYVAHKFPLCNTETGGPLKLGVFSMETVHIQKMKKMKNIPVGTLENWTLVLKAHEIYLLEVIFCEPRRGQYLGKRCNREWQKNKERKSCLALHYQPTHVKADIWSITPHH